MSSYISILRKCITVFICSACCLTISLPSGVEANALELKYPPEKALQNQGKMILTEKESRFLGEGERNIRNFLFGKFPVGVEEWKWKPMWRWAKFAEDSEVTKRQMERVYATQQSFPRQTSVKTKATHRWKGKHQQAISTAAISRRVAQSFYFHRTLKFSMKTNLYFSWDV